MTHNAENYAPPDGWVTFGSLIEHPGPVEFSNETDEAGMPLWERVIPPGECDCDYWHDKHRSHCAVNYPARSWRNPADWTPTTNNPKDQL